MYYYPIPSLELSDFVKYGHWPHVHDIGIEVDNTNVNYFAELEHPYLESESVVWLRFDLKPVGQLRFVDVAKIYHQHNTRIDLPFLKLNVMANFALVQANRLERFHKGKSESGDTKRFGNGEIELLGIPKHAMISGTFGELQNIDILLTDLPANILQDYALVAFRPNSTCLFHQVDLIAFQPLSPSSKTFRDENLVEWKLKRSNVLCDHDILNRISVGAQRLNEAIECMTDLGVPLDRQKCNEELGKGVSLLMLHRKEGLSLQDILKDGEDIWDIRQSKKHVKLENGQLLSLAFYNRAMSNVPNTDKPYSYLLDVVQCEFLILGKEKDDVEKSPSWTAIKKYSNREQTNLCDLYAEIVKNGLKLEKLNPSLKSSWPFLDDKHPMLTRALYLQCIHCIDKSESNPLKPRIRPDLLKRPINEEYFESWKYAMLLVGLWEGRAGLYLDIILRSNSAVVKSDLKVEPGGRWLIPQWQKHWNRLITLFKRMHPVSKGLKLYP